MIQPQAGAPAAYHNVLPAGKARAQLMGRDMLCEGPKTSLFAGKAAPNPVEAALEIEADGADSELLSRPLTPEGLSEAEEDAGEGALTAFVL